MAEEACAAHADGAASALVAGAALCVGTCPDEKLAWVLVVRIDTADLAPNVASTTDSYRVRVKYGDHSAFQLWQTGAAQSRGAKNSRSKVDFGSTCAFAWYRPFNQVLRFSVRKIGLIERTVAKATLEIPFCEKRGAGWLIWPGNEDQELMLRTKFTGRDGGHLNITVEMRGVPQHQLGAQLTSILPPLDCSQEDTRHAVALGLAPLPRKGIDDTGDAAITETIDGVTALGDCCASATGTPLRAWVAA